MEKKVKYIFYRESFVQSVLSDLFTYGMLVGSFWLNYLFVESKILAAILVIMFVIMFVLGLYSRAINKAKKFTDVLELQDYVKSLKE